MYRWQKEYMPEGDKTRYAALEEENRVLCLENAELKIERDLLKNRNLLCQTAEIKHRLLSE